MTSSDALETPAVLEGVDLVLFDLDGVLTPTAEVHMRAWARLFEPLLAARGVPGYTDADYFTHIDGRPRYEGVAALLASRGIVLEHGRPADPPDALTVCGLGNRKDATFAALIATTGVDPYPGSVRLLDRLAAAGIRSAVVSSSRNADAVLRAAGLRERFDTVVDGGLAADRHLAGKPAPATYLYAAEVMGVVPSRAAVVEDAVSGVEAGRAGGFALVVGVDRGVGSARLLAGGAHVVVNDLDQLVVPQPTSPTGATHTQE